MGLADLSSFLTYLLPCSSLYCSFKHWEHEKVDTVSFKLQNSIKCISTNCISQTTEFRLQVKNKNRKGHLSKVIPMLHKQNMVVYLVYISQCIFTGKFHGIDLHSRPRVRGLILTHPGCQKEHKRPCGANQLVVHLQNGQKTEFKLQWYLEIKISVTALNIFQTYYDSKSWRRPINKFVSKW